jgi:FkbM family methyltransferase
MIQALRFLVGKRNKSLKATKNGINWNLDLSEAIDFNIYLTGIYEVELAKKMQEHIKEGDYVLDIGANVGGHTLPLAKMVGETGHVFAIEPTDFAFDKLKRNLELNPRLQNRVTAAKIFLNDAHSELPQSVSASWSINGSMGAQERNQLDMGYGMSIENARATTLDELIESLNITKLDAIKLDVDGHEVQVLRGAEKTLNTLSPVIFIEFSPIHYEGQGSTFTEQVELLTKHGYAFEDVFGNQLPTNANDLMNSIPRGTLVNAVAQKKSSNESRKRSNEIKLRELKETLSNYMARQRDSWSFLKVIRPGYASKKLYAIYMMETYHYTFHNSRNQAAIPARRDEMDINYMKFCLHHAEEEAGHEMMAFSDIKKLGFNISKNNLPEPLPATQELIRYIYEIAENANPLARLGYSFWAERVYTYITPLLKLMKFGAGIPDKSMTFFNEHSDIDAKHAEDVDEAILRFAKTDADWKAIEECMIGTLDRTIKMTHEVLAEYDKVRDNQETRYKELFEGAT